jgi:hypothetical protein
VQREQRRVWDGLDHRFRTPGQPRAPVAGATDEEVANALEAVGKFTNQITIKEAHGALIRMTAKQPALFRSPLMLVRMHEFLANFTYELWVRRFLLNIFSKSVPWGEESSWELLDEEE